MTKSKVVSSEAKSGYSPEEMMKLSSKIEAALARANELNSDSLEIKAAMALENKFITPQQEQELFAVVNGSGELYDRYNKGERTEDLLAGIEQHCQALEQKRNEIFPDAPKEAKLKLAKNVEVSAVQQKEDVAGKKGTLKIKPKGEAKEETPEGPAPEEVVTIDETLLARRAEEIKQKRVNNEKGFEWEKIDNLLRQKGLEPGTPEAAEFMAQWDKNTAASELRKEAAKEKREEAETAKREEREFLKIKPVKQPDSARAAEKKENELARQGAEITLSKITNYKELWAETEQAGDEVFKQKTRELWKEFAVHGKVLKDKESGQPKLMQFTDLDGNSSLGLLKLAGIDIDKLEYKEPGQYSEGRINVDTGERHGVVVEDGGRTVFIDHHGDESGRDSSATKFTYELLVSLGLLEKQEHLDKLVEFVTQADSKTYPEEEKYFKNYYRNLLGLKDHVKFGHLVEFFKEGHQPHEVLQEKELEKMGLLRVSKQKKAMVEASLAELAKMKDRGFIIVTPRYGRVVVDINKRIPFGFDATKAAGYQTYLSWVPTENSFFISSVFPLTDSFDQGKNIRQVMWIKPAIDGAPLAVSLKDVLLKMTDGQLAPSGELAEFLAKEKQEKSEPKVELAPEKAEILKKVGQQVFDSLRDDADWSGHTEKEKSATLEIQTKVFLRKRLEKINLVDEKTIDELFNSLIK